MRVSRRISGRKAIVWVWPPRAPAPMVVPTAIYPSVVGSSKVIRLASSPVKLS